jgi:hypothetical protein
MKHVHIGIIQTLDLEPRFIGPLLIEPKAHEAEETSLVRMWTATAA